MSKTVKQFRYYNDGNENNQSNTYQKPDNQPVNLRAENLTSIGDNNFIISSDIMQEIGRITHLGIQGLPGTKVYINNNREPIIIGNLGVFELDLTNYSFIWSVQFNPMSIKSIEQNRNGYLIVDVIYDTEV